MKLRNKTTFFAAGSVLIALVLVTTVLHSGGSTDLGAPMPAEAYGEGDDPLTEGLSGDPMSGKSDGPFAAHHAQDAGKLGAKMSSRADALEDLEFERGRVEIEQVIDLSDSEMAPLPESATGIGPGSRLVISIPNEGTFGCTANFVWEDKDDKDKLHLGAAGHCFLPANERATHGETPASANYDASGVTVWVCVSSCTFGGQSGFIFSGNLRTLGEVAYARQTGTGGDLGNDFGIVEIPSEFHNTLVRYEMPVWGGPVGEGSVSAFTPIVHYGSGVVYGETYLGQARAGYSIFNTGTQWFAAEAAASFGDSGSAVNTAVLSTSNGLEGNLAGGILTHLVVWTEVVAGTQVPQAKSMTLSDASIDIQVKT